MLRGRKWRLFDHGTGNEQEQATSWAEVGSGRIFDTMIMINATGDVFKSKYGNQTGLHHFILQLILQGRSEDTPLKLTLQASVRPPPSVHSFQAEPTQSLIQFFLRAV